jgi:PrtD family type I secretion system ABC transporter
MPKLLAGLRPYLAFAGLFSLALNLLLLAPALYMLQVFDRVLTSRSGETLAVLSLAVLIALLTMAALDVMRAYLLAAVGAALDRMLGPKVLEGLLGEAARLGGRDHAHALRDVHCLRSFFSGAGILALFDAPWLPIFLLIITLFHPLMGALALFGALTMLTLAFFNERLTHAPLERAQTEGRKAARFIDLSLRNAEVVNALGMLPAVTRRWTELNERALAEQAGATRAGAALSGMTKFTRQSIQSAMLALGAYIVLDQQVTAGVMIAATILLGRALAPVEQLVAGWRALVEARAAWRRLDALFSAPAAETRTVLPAPEGKLAAEAVVFGLRGASKPIIRGASFSINAGEALGIVGPSASGKSTLARLLIGIHRTSAGTVRLDGADVSAWPRESLGRHIGYMPQDVELFPGTVTQNIARLEAPDSAEVIRAAQRAHVHEMVLRLPQGSDTELGEAAGALSPGQRQRIALARALYGDPRLVLLDEPNANLDAEGEQALAATLRGLKEEGVTLVVIAHRPSLLDSVDKVLVMRDGAVEAFGPRSEILQRVLRRAA